MDTYFMFGKYSAESIKRIIAERTKKANNIIFFRPSYNYKKIDKILA